MLGLMCVLGCLQRLGQLVKLPLNAEVFPRAGDLGTLIIRVPVEGLGSQR